MNIVAGPGIINVPADIWDQVVAFYTAQLGPPTSDDGNVAIWQQGPSEFKLVKIVAEAFSGEPNVFLGWPSSPTGGHNLNVSPVYPDHQGSSLAPYTITLASIKLPSALFAQGKVYIEFGVIHNPPY